MFSRHHRAFAHCFLNLFWAKASPDRDKAKYRSTTVGIDEV
jgi:hypothetical protein